MTDKKAKVNVVIPDGIKELAELIKAGDEMIADLKSEKRNPAIRKIGEALEADKALVDELSERESVQKFAKELRDVLVLPHTNKKPLAALLTALILHPR